MPRNHTHPPAVALGPNAYLVPISGPALEAITLSPTPHPLVMGRHERCDLLLPADADKVSRFHARFTFADNRWTITDLTSRWGTFLNGRKLPPDESVQLSEGDLIRIAPWTFAFSKTPSRPGLHLGDDSTRMETLVRTIVPGGAGPGGGAQRSSIGEDLLTILLESAAGIHGAQSEKALAEMILDSAIRGTGLKNATLLRPLDAAGKFEILASRQVAEGAAYSRTLIRAAASGHVAEFSASNLSANAPVAQSIAEMHVSAAICVPLMLGDTVAAFLYLDARGDMFAVRPNAAAFCVGLGRIASLALANLKRIDMERRQASVDAELSAGAEAQRWILPPRSQTFGPLSYIGESRAGRYVGGDFFDVVPLDANRVAFALGDVAGKGIPASVLMTAAQGYLHGALMERPDIGDAVTALNRFICPRCPAGKFLTLWVGVVDTSQNLLTYVDAGHGYALAGDRAAPLAIIRGESEFPVGVSADTLYTAQSRPLAPGSRLLIVSDGLVEQPALPSADTDARDQFGVDRISAALAATTADPITTLFNSLIAFATTPRLADDTTALYITLA